MRVLITRPREDGEAIAARLASAGHQPLLAPLLETRWLDGPPPDLTDIAAILATSANGVRALVRRMQTAKPASPFARSAPKEEVAVAGSRASYGRRGFLDMPLFAVGPQTAQEARDAGFTRVENANGDARALAQAVPRWIAPDAGTLLHVCGADSAGNLAQDLAARGYAARREILYAVEARPLPPGAAAALRDGALDAALFFSPRSARIFLEQSEGAALSRLTALCISPATAAVLPPDLFGAVRVAAAPNQEALLALLEQGR